MKQRRVWAPFARTIQLSTEGHRIAMKADEGGWWTAELDDRIAESDYAFGIDGGEPLPDPRSPWQPSGAFGPSRPVDHSRFRWTDDSWNQPPLGIIYECHVGTFTEEGTFDSVTDKLEYLKGLGITHLELMPVSEFPGVRGWGYDGVDLFAPHHAYGGPDGLKRLVDRCHSIGLAVILDVVYNHLGPSGNFLQQFGPYLTDRYRTPWGNAINLDGEYSHEVRRFLCDNALMWLRDYHIDGLRLDAVHAIFDSSAIHFLKQLASEVRVLSVQLRRHFVLTAESELNNPRLVISPEAGGYGLDAQWSDDFHHALHSSLTGETSGYYADFGSLSNVAKALHSPYVYDGTFSKFRKRHHGRPAGDLPANRFVVCTQNHDQVGNRARGDRLSQLVSVAQLKIAAALLICSPFVPLIFQGEEWAASSPFLYFENHEDLALVAAIREGRRKEFAHFFKSVDDVPDPHARETFIASKLKWNERGDGDHADILKWYRNLLELRRSMPDLSDPRLDEMEVTYDESMRWLAMRRGSTMLVSNFSDSLCHVPAEGLENARLVLASNEAIAINRGAAELPPVSVAILSLG